jgi:hypothetical protein
VQVVVLVVGQCWMRRRVAKLLVVRVVVCGWASERGGAWLAVAFFAGEGGGWWRKGFLLQGRKWREGSCFKDASGCEGCAFVRDEGEGAREGGAFVRDEGEVGREGGAFVRDEVAGACEDCFDGCGLKCVLPMRNVDGGGGILAVGDGMVVVDRKSVV